MFSFIRKQSSSMPLERRFQLLVVNGSSPSRGRQFASFAVIAASLLPLGISWFYSELAWCSADLKAGWGSPEQIDQAIELTNKSAVLAAMGLMGVAAGFTVLLTQHKSVAVQVGRGVMLFVLLAMVYFFASAVFSLVLTHPAGWVCA